MLQKGVLNSMTTETACLAGSHCHEIYTEEINKISLSSDDDKRVI